MFSTAAIVMALSFNAFAGTPEKAEAKPEAKTENTQMAHRYINVGNGNYLPEQEVGSPGCNTTDLLPCSIESDEWEPAGFEYDNKPGDSQESLETGKYTAP